MYTFHDFVNFIKTLWDCLLQYSSGTTYWFLNINVIRTIY